MNQYIEAIVAIVCLAATGLSYHLHREAKLAMYQLKNSLLQFENTFVDRLNGRYIRKPDSEEDYPLTRREHTLARAEADKEHARFDKELDQLWSTVNKAKS